MSDPPDRIDDAARLQFVGIIITIIGGAFLLFISFAAISHYGFGTPIRVRRNYGLAPETFIILGITVFVTAGIALVFIGARMRRAARNLLEEDT